MYEYVGPDDWGQYALYDIAKWKNGLAFRNISFSEIGKPILKIAELKSGVTDQTKFTQEQYDSEVLVQEGDLLFSWSGNPDTSIDIFKWRGAEGWLNQHIFKVTPGEDVLPEFFFFLMKWLKPRFAEIARNKQTTGLGHVTIQDLKNMKIGLPEKKEQEAILEIIHPLQSKIDLNYRMNETLEGTARTLFKDWFIDFGPVKAKAAGQIPPGLDEDIAALFPDALDEEGVPVGWKETKLNEIIEFNPSERLPSGQSASYLDMASLPTTGSWPEKPIQRVVGSGMKFRNGDTLFARITPCLENGKAAFIQCLKENEVAWGSTEFIVLRPKSPWPKEIGYLLARDNNFRKYAIQSMTGTSGRQRAQASQIANYELFLPVNNEIPLAFGEVVNSLFLQIKSNCEESFLLSCLRDTLLPKLISGDIRVQDVENQLEEVS